VIVMDVDLKDPPEVTPLFLERWREGFDVVYEQRAGRGRGAVKRGSAQLFYRLFNRLYGRAHPA
jgi:hypothetical protein